MQALQTQPVRMAANVYRGSVYRVPMDGVSVQTYVVRMRTALKVGSVDRLPTPDLTQSLSVWLRDESNACLAIPMAIVAAV